MFCNCYCCNKVLYHWLLYNVTKNLIQFAWSMIIVRTIQMHFHDILLNLLSIGSFYYFIVSNFNQRRLQVRNVYNCIAYCITCFYHIKITSQIKMWLEWLMTHIRIKILPSIIIHSIVYCIQLSSLIMGYNFYINLDLDVSYNFYAFIISTLLSTIYCTRLTCHTICCG